VNTKKEIIEELTSIWSPKQFSATNYAPRKDFVPFSARDSAAYHRQSGDFPPATPIPPNPASLPFELSHIVDDLSDSYIYLKISLKKIAQCLRNSPSLTKRQKKQLWFFYKKLKNDLNSIFDVGSKIEDVCNIATQPTPDASVPVAKKSIKRN
jgi:hypothetical protein